MTHPYHDVAIVGVHNTTQALEIEGHDAESIALVGALGALADARIPPSEVDGVVGQFAQETVLELGLGPCTRRPNMLGIPAVLEAASLIASGECEVVLISAGGARLHRERSHTAPWTRPANELVVGYGLFTAAEFALMARRHMITHGTTPEQLATVAATIRNNGHDNPDAVYFQKGPFTPDDILSSRMVADPFHLLDCAMTSEGGCGIVLASAGRAHDRGGRGLDPRRSDRLVRAGIHRRSRVGLQEPQGRRSGRRGRCACSSDRVQERRPLPHRRGRGRAL